MANSILNLLSKFISNPLGALNLPNIQIFQFSIVTIIVVLYVLARIIMSAIGRRYTTPRVFIGPIIMILLVAYNYYFSYIASSTLNIDILLRIETLVVPVIVLVGLVVGHRVAKGDRVFLKKGKAHYRSSIAITLLWAISFLVKMGMVAFIPTILLEVGITFSIVLDITTGLILGEALKIHHIYREQFSGTTGS